MGEKLNPNFAQLDSTLNDWHLTHIISDWKVLRHYKQAEKGAAEFLILSHARISQVSTDVFEVEVPPQLYLLTRTESNLKYWHNGIAVVFREALAFLNGRIEKNIQEQPDVYDDGKSPGMYFEELKTRAFALGFSPEELGLGQVSDENNS